MLVEGSMLLVEDSMVLDSIVEDNTLEGNMLLVEVRSMDRDHSSSLLA